MALPAGKAIHIRNQCRKLSFRGAQQATNFVQVRQCINQLGLPEQRSALRSQLEQIQGMGSAEEYVRAMRKRYKVQVEESQL